MTWLRAIMMDGLLETEDRVVFGEYLALLDYKLDRGSRSWRWMTVAG